MQHLPVSWLLYLVCQILLEPDSLPFQLQDSNPAHFKTSQAAPFSASATSLYTLSCWDTHRVCQGDLNSPIKTTCCVSAYSQPHWTHLESITSGWHRCLIWALGVQPWHHIFLLVWDVTCRNAIVLICSHSIFMFLHLTASLTYDTHSYSFFFFFLHWQPGNASTHPKDRVKLLLSVCPS